VAAVDQPQLVIGYPDSRHVVVRPQRYRHPDASDYWGGNWLDASIEVQAGAFSGRMAATLRTEEFRAFHGELATLYETLMGQAAFSSLESWLGVKLTVGSSGQVAVTGWVEDEPSIGNRLEAILARFPVVGEDINY
jgi:hypothetical protein